VFVEQIAVWMRASAPLFNTIDHTVSPILRGALAGTYDE
jgi:hypothetical protein